MVAKLGESITKANFLQFNNNFTGLGVEDGMSLRCTFKSFSHIVFAQERERESLLAQTLNNFIQIKDKALGHRKKTVKQVVSSGALDSFINSYRGLTVS